jgi:hypothetical protein
MTETTLIEVRDALRRVAGGLDVSRIPTASAATLLSVADDIERMTAALKAQLATRAADSGTWRATGAKSPAHHLASQTGTTLTAAQQLLDTGRRLDHLPDVADAARAGRLSPQQTAAITAAAEADPSAAPRLIDFATTRSLGELRDECANVRATQEDPEARRKRIHDARYLRRRREVDGAATVELRDNPEVVAELMSLIAPERERLFTAARKDGRRERPDALDLDALMATLRRATGTTDAAPRRPSTAKVLVRIDFDTLLRGYPTTGETCEIVGYGPIAVSAVTDLIASGNAFLAAIATKGHQVLGVAHLGRKPTAYQDTALEWADPTCAAAGCNRALRLERDHRIPWADTKITLYDTLDRLCTTHHRQKTTANWALEPGQGKRAFVPPTDPRHPDHPANAPPGAA